MKKIRSLVSIAVAVMLLSGMLPAAAADTSELNRIISDTTDYMLRTVKDPQVGSIGGEWAVIGLARSSAGVEERYYQKYYATVEKYVKACEGKLHDKKYTEYSRVALALTAIGKDPADVAGYDLLTPLGDYEKTIWQGINGPIWALIALDSGNYDMPQNPDANVQATRQMYIDCILDRQLPDGGFSLTGGTGPSPGNERSDPDITGMALQALAKYQDQDRVKQVTEEALACLSKIQDAQGGYASWGAANSESTVQVIVGLCELGLSLDDERFVKDGHTLLDNLLTFYVAGNGFMHTSQGTGSNQMACEQGLYALVAVQRALNSESSLYRMVDTEELPEAQDNFKPGEGLEGKNASVTTQPIVTPGKTFDDVSGEQPHQNVTAIEALAQRNIINGKTQELFDPDATMTRAEFAAIVVRGLGLPQRTTTQFTDVESAIWYAPYIGAAFDYGIITGTSDTTFDPAGTITREAAATMVARAASLCGMETGMETVEVRDMLAQFADYTQCAQWARPSLAFCYREGILSQSDLQIQPQADITRGEVAQMLFHLLGCANLL